jgi:hypothetical protein
MGVFSLTYIYNAFLYKMLPKFLIYTNLNICGTAMPSLQVRSAAGLGGSIGPEFPKKQEVFDE